MAPSANDSRKQLANNRRARRDYFVDETFETGIELRGTEVKSMRAGQFSLTGAFARVEEGDVILHHMTISPYEHGNRFNHEPERPRRLLLHAAQIRHLAVQTDQKGHALVPLSVYLKRGLVKVELGVCRGKRQADKRETMRRKTADMEARRAMARHFR